LYFVSI